MGWIEPEAGLSLLERLLQGKDRNLLDLEALNRERARLEAELKQRKTEVDGLMAERDQLKTRLDTTPVAAKAAPAKVVRLPASRPIPEGAKIEQLVATKDDVYWLDLEGAKEAFLKEFKSSAIRDMKKERAKRDKDTTVVVYDSKMLAQHFEKRKLVYSDWRLGVVFANWTASPIVRLLPREKPSATSVPAVMRRVQENAKAVVLVHVTADGFDNYLAVRERFDRFDVPAGWDFVGAPEFQFVVNEILTNQPVAPPKPAAPAAAGPAANVIRNPTPKLD